LLVSVPSLGNEGLGGESEVKFEVESSTVLLIVLFEDFFFLIGATANSKGSALIDSTNSLFFLLHFSISLLTYK
jgi:hypothetical protein